MLKISQAKGEGQGSCRSCDDKGKWNCSWMCFLYKVEGIDGCFCEECIKNKEYLKYMVGD